MICLRVLEVVSSFYPNVGGSETFTDELSTRLTEKFDVDCLILHSERPGSRSTQIRTGRVPTISVPPDIMLSTTPFGIEWLDLSKEVLSDFQPDLVHISLPLPGLADVVAWSAARRALPVLLTYHNDVLGWNLIQGMMALTYNLSLGTITRRLAVRIVVDSTSYAQSSPWLARHRHKILAISPGISDDFLRPDAVPDYDSRPQDIIFVGRLEAGAGYKGLPVLLRALKMLTDKREAFSLTVVGGGSWHGKYEKLVADMQLGKEVTFAGGVPRSELISLLRQHKAFVMPSTSRAEGFGLALMEAQSQGLPVVASNIGGLPGAMVPGKTGFLVRPGDAAAVATGVADLLSDKDEWTRKSRAAADFGRAANWDNAARKYLDVFETILAEKTATKQPGSARNGTTRRSAK